MIWIAIALSILLGFLLGSMEHWWPEVKYVWRWLWRRRRAKKQFEKMAADMHFVEGTPQQQATRFRQRTNDGGNAGQARVRTARVRFRAPRQK